MEVIETLEKCVGLLLIEPLGQEVTWVKFSDFTLRQR